MEREDKTFMAISTAEEIIKLQQEKIQQLEQINNKDNAYWTQVVTEITAEKVALEKHLDSLIIYIKKQRESTNTKLTTNLTP